MPNFNKVILAGNMVRDPELKYTQGGTAVAEFGIAINRRWEKDGQKQEEVTYVDCKAWARTAEVICEFFTKGKPILVEGRLTQERWEKDGQKRSKILMTVERFEFLGGEKKEGEKHESKPAPAKPSQPDRVREAFGGQDDPAPKEMADMPAYDAPPGPQDDIPF